MWLGTLWRATHTTCALPASTSCMSPGPRASQLCQGWIGRVARGTTFSSNASYLVRPAMSGEALLELQPVHPPASLGWILPVGVMHTTQYDLSLTTEPCQLSFTELPFWCPW